MNPVQTRFSTPLLEPVSRLAPAPADPRDTAPPSGLAAKGANHSFSQGWRALAEASGEVEARLPGTLEDRARHLHQIAARERAKVQAGSQDDAQAVRATLRHAANLANGDSDDFIRLAANVLVDLDQVPAAARDRLALDRDQPNRFHVPFGDTGFQQRLRDRDGNLVHHMGFYFVAGYALQKAGREHGSMAGLIGVAVHELEPLLGSGQNPNLLPDLRSGHAGITMGRWLAENPDRLGDVDLLWQVDTMEEKP